MLRVGSSYDSYATRFTVCECLRLDKNKPDSLFSAFCALRFVGVCLTHASGHILKYCLFFQAGEGGM